MINRDTVQAIKDKQMDRKDFLKYSGLVLLSVVGLKTFANLISKVDVNQSAKHESSRGFGGGKYGV